MKHTELTLYDSPRVILRTDNPSVAVLEIKVGWIAPSYTKELTRDELVRIGKGFIEMAERMNEIS